jgi:hypothetical protein
MTVDGHKTLVRERSLIMLGFFGLMAVLMALILLASYWISWDLQHKEYRPSFATKALDDLADLLGKCRRVLQNGESRRRTALDAYGNQETERKTNSVVLRSEHS